MSTIIFDFIDMMYGFVFDGYLGWLVFAIGIVITVCGVFELISRIKGLNSAMIGMIVGLLTAGPQVMFDGIWWWVLMQGLVPYGSLGWDIGMSIFLSTLLFGFLISVFAYTAGIINYYYKKARLKDKCLIGIKKTKS